ncbi:unnamed protein product [Urochloa decumbens]|uniref:DUF6598 domain-containing protein n=1 Tax=Urochloa decumbens TaxID=240449 RepID=A0ABC8VFK4_9POAL
MTSDPLRRWRFPLMAAPDPPVRRVSRFSHVSRSMASGSGVGGEEEPVKPDSRPAMPSVKDIMISLGERSQRMRNVENSDITKEFIARHGYGHPANVEEDGRKTIVDAIYGDEEAPRTTVEVTDGKQETWGKWGDVLMDTDRRATKGRNVEIMVSDDEENVNWTAEIPHYSVDTVPPLNRLPDSSHRDGSIYRDTHSLKKDYRVVDRRETCLEAMMLSEPTNCIMRDGTCKNHRPQRMLQIFSLKLAKSPVDAGSVELYGYIAARDDLDPLLNYVINVSRDDPIIVEQGSLINMAPKRGIKLGLSTLIEYDMKIKTGGHEKDDLQLIDGISVLSKMDTDNCSVFTCRIIGDSGAIDISASRIDYAVEATVEVILSEVHGSFNMSLSCFTSELDEEIQLFDGTIGESCGLGRSVVAVEMGTQMDLKIKVGSEPSGSSEYCCSFEAHNHGRASELIKTDFASISVKVTWSVLPHPWMSVRSKQNTVVTVPLGTSLLCSGVPMN